ncbi:invasion associated locus B family protein [Afifella sp. IM 167]|uniref:invasion associated locus B family protein n=1 Tax=Afifella sp. IM 167 TaxID=2033586 RepID=UPI001CC9BC93|nr:invasion associated locus B family protein [Afifella sp. IM 167]MBZ8132479.1 invasion-associated locus B family protein [Afifella sp. IM 167]
MHFSKAATASTRGFARIAAGLLVAFAVSPAWAQDQQPAAGDQAAPGETQQPDWVKLCSENPANKQEVCVTTRERRAATGQLLAAVSLRETEGKKFLVSAVPPGMLLRPGMQVQVDGGTATKVQYSICFPNLCFAETEVNDEFIASMKKGSRLVITTLNQQAKPVNFDLSLSGFTASYEGPAIDPKELQAEQQKLEDELKRKAEEARKQLIERQQQSTQQQQ